MTRKNEANKSGGFFRKLFPCRPRRPEDTGAIVTNNTNSAVIEKKSTHAIENNTRDIPLLLPTPPSDEATPITSNRKSLNNHIYKNTNFISASTRLKQDRTAKIPIAELEASNNEAENNKKEGRKSYPTFSNKHPLQENVKAKLEWFETAFASPQNQPDSTENTEDTTENSMSETDDFRTLPPASSLEETIVDCGNDPWERAYAVWYRKGLLKWCPKSVAVESEAVPMNEKSAIDSETEVATEITAGGSIDLEIVERKESPILGKSSAPLEEVGNDDVDDAALLMKYRSKPATACVKCGKDTSFTIALVRCVQCKQELYCSVFCRGNDRYNHAVNCIALARHNAENPTKSSIKKVKVPAAFATEHEEEKKEERKDPSVPQAATSHPEKDRSQSSNLKVPEMLALDQDRSKKGRNNDVVVVDPSQVAQAAQLEPPSTPSTPNVSLYTDVHQTSSSRLNSLRKSKAVPMVSLFGADAVNERIASPRRLTTKSV